MSGGRAEILETNLGCELSQASLAEDEANCRGRPGQVGSESSQAITGAISLFVARQVPIT